VPAPGGGRGLFLELLFQVAHALAQLLEQVVVAVDLVFVRVLFAQQFLHLVIQPLDLLLQLLNLRFYIIGHFGFPQDVATDGDCL
jgi:hypothetical protein